MIRRGKVVFLQVDLLDDRNVEIEGERVADIERVATFKEVKVDNVG